MDRKSKGTSCCSPASNAVRLCCPAWCPAPPRDAAAPAALQTMAEPLPAAAGDAPGAPRG